MRPSPGDSAATLQVDAMGIEALDVVHTLHRQCFDQASGEFWQREHFAQMLDRLHAPVIIGSIDAGQCMIEPVGYLFLRHVLDEAEILSIAVVPSYRCRGFAGDLLDAAIRHFKSQQINRAFLEVRSDNVAALSLYASRGFTSTGTRKNYYRSKTGALRDATTMTLDLKS